MRHIAWTLLLGSLAASVLRALDAPLPWLLGPLAATAACRIRGLPAAASPLLLNTGQWAIGCALGLYFTPQVLRVLPALAPAIVAGALWAIAMGYAFHRLLWRANAREPGMDRATAFFAATIGGASEMAVLAQRHGARVDLVAAAHSLRLLLVVIVIPFAFHAIGVRGVDSLPSLPQRVQIEGLGLMGCASLALGWAMRRAGLPNPWLLGALAATAALTGSGAAVSAMPTWATSLAQLFIGVALGVRFTPDFLDAAPRWLGTVALGTVGMMACSGAFAWVLGQLAGLPASSVLLGTSPGGIAEMCITARELQLGVPVVTAFHVVRYVVVLLTAEPLYERLADR